MHVETLLLFATTSLVLAITPGPTMLLALSNGVSGGLRVAFFGMLGASLGSSTLIAAVALGLGSLLAASQLLFELVRWIGVAYLAWLGVKLWRSRPQSVAEAMGAQAGSPLGARAAFSRSLTVALSNPKTLLFFGAFLPQFVDTAAPQAPQFLILGAVFVTLDSLVMVAYAALGSHALRWMSARSLRLINRGCGLGMWALAGTLAFWRRATA